MVENGKEWWERMVRKDNVEEWEGRMVRKDNVEEWEGRMVRKDNIKEWEGRMVRKDNVEEWEGQMVRKDNIKEWREKWWDSRYYEKSHPLNTEMDDQYSRMVVGYQLTFFHQWQLLIRGGLKT